MKEIWTKEKCKECGRENWIFFACDEDLSKLDPEGYNCWNCKAVNIFDTDIVIEKGCEIITDGLREPNS